MTENRLDYIENLMERMSDIDILSPQIVAMRELLGKLHDEQIVVSIIGQFKRGKTTLVNRILGRELLPVGIVPLTSIVTKIKNEATVRAVVYFKNGSEELVPPETVHEFVSEQENRNNCKNVDYVDIRYPCPILGENVTLVDTPGVGSIHGHNTEASYSFVRRSDAVCFMLSVDSPINELERDFLLNTAEHASKFFFVVNKVDMISERDRFEYLRYCRDVLADLLGREDITLFPISATSGEGVEELLTAVRSEFENSAVEILQSSVDLKTSNILREALAKLRLYTNALSLPHEELIRKSVALRKKMSELNDFYETAFLSAEKKSERLIDDIDTRFLKELPEIRERARKVLQEVYSQSKDESSKKFETILSKAMEKYLTESLEELYKAGLHMLDEGYAALVASMNARVNEVKMFVAQSVKQYFGTEYALSVGDYKVSERSDFYVRVNQSGSGVLININASVHLLPKGVANRKIYVRTIQRLDRELEQNRTNMIYNYRLKMRESLRPLFSDFKSDVVRLQDDIGRVLERAGRRAEKESEIAGGAQERAEALHACLLEALDAFSVSMNCTAASL